MHYHVRIVGLADASVEVGAVVVESRDAFVASLALLGGLTDVSLTQVAKIGALFTSALRLKCYREGFHPRFLALLGRWGRCS